jgi:hypothetical protein
MLGGEGWRAVAVLQATIFGGLCYLTESLRRIQARERVPASLATVAPSERGRWQAWGLLSFLGLVVSLAVWLGVLVEITGDSDRTEDAGVAPVGPFPLGPLVVPRRVVPEVEQLPQFPPEVRRHIRLVPDVTETPPRSAVV